MNKQHVQVPKMNLKEEGLNFIDPYVYACIKRYMNNSTKISFPSLVTLVQDSKVTKPTILKSIKRLEQAGYIKTEKKKGLSTHYHFNDYKKFEIFSFEFLDNDNLTPKEKAYLITMQNKMYKDNTLEIGKVTLSNTEISDSLNIDYRSIKKYEQSLQDKDILQIIPIQNRDEYGLVMNERIYSFENFANLLALKFQQTDKTLKDHEDRISKQEKETQKQFEILQKQLEVLQNQIKELTESKDIIL